MNEQQYPHDSVGVEELQQFIVSVPGLEGAEVRYDIAEGVKSVPDPGLFEGPFQT